jgi:hypothetical protein
MRMRTMLPLAALVMAACTTQDGRGTRQARAEDVLVLGSDDGVVSVDTATGSVVFDGRGVPALGTWSKVFAASPSGGGAVLEARDSTTGEVLSSVQIPGDLAVRVASSDGSRVALMAPLPQGQGPWVPEPRAFSTIVVADPTGMEEIAHYRLKGNFEPEAFSFDGRSLFLIKLVPPTDPEAYRVARLSLATGKVSPVNTGIKGVVETMSGTRLEQIASPDGTMLYTLYTTAPAAYADDTSHHGDHVAFVHTLSLDDGWAHCVGLPRVLWGGDPEDQAMALSPNGRSLYVVDTSRAFVAVMDTGGPEMARQTHVQLGMPENGEAHAVVTEDLRLVVASGTRVVSLDTLTLEPVASWTMDAPISALGLGPAGVYVATPGAIQVMDPSSGRPVRSIPTPALDGRAFVAMLPA